LIGALAWPGMDNLERASRSKTRLGSQYLVTLHTCGALRNLLLLQRFFRHHVFPMDEVLAIKYDDKLPARHLGDVLAVRHCVDKIVKF
jgi:hypothetical protein